MLKILLRSRLEALLSILTGAGRTKKAQSRGKLIGFAALMILSLVSLGTLFSQIFGTIGEAFLAFHLGWLYFAMAAVMAFAIMLVGNIFAAKAQLFEARDNDLLLSMPIRPIHILISRLFLLLVLAEVLALPVVIPTALFWPGKLTGMGWFSFIVVYFVALPLLNLAVSALLGWLIHLAASRARNKSAITLVLSLGFMGLYMYFNFRMNSMLTSLAADPSGLERSLGSAAPLVWAGRAVAEGSGSCLALLLAICLALFALSLVLLARTFIRTATAKGGGAKRLYVERTATLHSPRSALLIHELRRLWASPAYLLNGALGSFFLLAAAVALLVKGGDLVSSPTWAELAPLMRPLLLLGLCFMAAMTFLTAPSISLEGKSLWLPKSLPVTSWEILQAKLRLHMLIGLPPLVLCSGILAWRLGYEGGMLALVLLLPLTFGVFSGLFGLFESLRHPNFNWINETQAVKSGASVLTTMFVGMGLVAAPAIVFLFLGDRITIEQLGCAMLALLLAASVLLYLWLRRKGPAVFDAL